MKSKLIIYLSLLLTFSACENSESLELPAAFVAQIQELKTDDEKSAYLHDLWQADQGLRKGQESEVMAKYGNNSKEHKELVKKLIASNKLIFKQLKKYLEIHGYPKQLEKYDELAINSFPIIIGHNHHYEEQKELLPYLYKAYQAGHCALGDLVWVMGEMHESKHRGRRYKMKANKFTTEQEFTELNEALNLGLSLN